MKPLLQSIGMLMHPYFVFPPHQHNAWELICVTHGEGEIVIGETSFCFHEGDIFLQPPEVPHSEHSENGYRNIHIALSAIPQTLTGVRHLHDTATNDIRAILMMIYRAHHWQDIPNAALSDSLMEVLFQFLQLANNTTMNCYVEQMVTALIANLSNADFSLANLYRELHINEDYARRMFRAQMNCSPLTYLTRIRIRHACNLLRSSNGELSIREVSERVGIRDALYFSRMFKTHIGESPTKWVKRVVLGEG